VFLVIEFVVSVSKTPVNENEIFLLTVTLTVMEITANNDN